MKAGNTVRPAKNTVFHAFVRLSRLQGQGNKSESPGNQGRVRSVPFASSAHHLNFMKHGMALHDRLSDAQKS